MHPILKASRKILTFKYYAKFAFIQIRDSMGTHLIFFIIFTLFSCIILTNQSLPWYSLRSGFQCDTKMGAVFSCMRPHAQSSPHFLFTTYSSLFSTLPPRPHLALQNSGCLMILTYITNTTSYIAKKTGVA